MVVPSCWCAGGPLWSHRHCWTDCDRRDWRWTGCTVGVLQFQSIMVRLYKWISTYFPSSWKSQVTGVLGKILFLTTLSARRVNSHSLWKRMKSLATYIKIPWQLEVKEDYVVSTGMFPDINIHQLTTRQANQLIWMFIRSSHKHYSDCFGTFMGCPDITVMVDWALQPNYLPIYSYRSQLPQNRFCSRRLAFL